MKRFFLSTVMIGILVSPSLVSAEAWDIDAAHSSITFKVRHLFTKVSGQFTDVSGTVDFDGEKPQNSSVEATIAVASLSTQNEKRDGHLKSPDFFDVEKYPEITFKSTKVKKSDDGLEVVGDFTMHGVTKPVALAVEFIGAGDHPMMPGAKVAGFTATTKIKRSEWGMEWNKAIEAGRALLGDEVEIQLDIEAVQMPPKSE